MMSSDLIQSQTGNNAPTLPYPTIPQPTLPHPTPTTPHLLQYPTPTMLQP